MGCMHLSLVGLLAAGLLLGDDTDDDGVGGDDNGGAGWAIWDVFALMTAVAFVGALVLVALVVDASAEAIVKAMVSGISISQSKTGVE